MSRLLALSLILAACSTPPVADVIGGPQPPSPRPLDVGANPASVPNRPSMTPRAEADSMVIERPDQLYSAVARFPQLRSGGASGGAINAQLVRDAQAFMDDPDLQPYSAQDVRESIEEGRPYSMTVEKSMDYAVARLDDRVFSVNRFIYAYTGGAHGNLWYQPATFDMTTGTRIRLADIVRTDPASLRQLSAAAERSLRRQGWDLDETWAEGFGPEAGNFTAFTLVPDSLVIHFAPYQVGPYAAGTFRAPIAISELQGVLADGAPVR